MNPASDLANLLFGIAGIYMDCEMYQTGGRSEQPPEYVPAPLHDHRPYKVTLRAFGQQGWVTADGPQ